MNQNSILRLIAIHVALAGFLMFPSHAEACSCSTPPRPEWGFEASDGVFVGEVVGINPSEPVPAIRALHDRPWIRPHLPANLGYHVLPGIELEVRVVTSWKGRTRQTVLLRTTGSSAACGYEASIGTTHLFYTSKYYGIESVSACSRSAAILDAGPDLRYLAGRSQQRLRSAWPKWPVASFIVAIAFTLLFVRRESDRRQG